MTTTDQRVDTSRVKEWPDPSTLLPLSPWTVLRPAAGMLLDTSDFEVVLGNPRAKHMLHNAWLHGSGVVWGLSVERSGEWDLEISPGIAIDGIGRELHLDEPRCISLREIIAANHDPTCASVEVELCLVLSFDACLDRPVPALADPCDVTRESQEYSRVDERARLGFVPGHPRSQHTYHRVRVLLGLDRVEDDDEPGREALDGRTEVLAAPSGQRASELLRLFHCFAAKDSQDLAPRDDEREPALFPVPTEAAGVVLACLRLTVRTESEYPELADVVTIDDCCRPTLIPTTVIQDLVCALAPGLIGSGSTSVRAEPQVVSDSVKWRLDANELSFEVTTDVLGATLTHESVLVSSLSETGWEVESLDRRPHYDAVERRVVVRLTRPPRNPLIRVVVMGSGSTPVYGADPRVPLAGVVGSDPGSPGQGSDAVLTAVYPRYEKAAQQEGVETGDQDEQ